MHQSLNEARSRLSRAACYSKSPIWMDSGIFPIRFHRNIIELHFFSEIRGNGLLFKKELSYPRLFQPRMLYMFSLNEISQLPCSSTGCDRKLSQLSLPTVILLYVMHLDGFVHLILYLFTGLTQIPPVTMW